MNKEVDKTSVEPTTVAKIIKIAKEVLKYIKELFSFRKLRKYILQKKIEAKQKEVAKALAEGRIEDAGHLQAEVRKLYEEFSLFEEIKDAIKTKLDEDKLKAGLEYLEIRDDTADTNTDTDIDTDTKDTENVSISSVEAPKCTEWSPSKPKPAVSEADRSKTLKTLLSNNLGKNSYNYTEKDIAIIRKGLEIKKKREMLMNSKTIKTIILATIGSGIVVLSGCKTYQPDYKTPEDIGERVKIVKPGDTILIPDLTQPAKTWYLVDDIGLSTWLGIPEDFIHNK